jgi:hypothetical protein
MTLNSLHLFQPLMNFSVDRHFIYITACTDEHKKQLQSYYKLMEEDLEDITKDWSIDLLIPVDPAEISDIDSPEIVHDTPEQGGDGEELDEKEVKQNQGDKVDPLKKRKGSPPKTSSQKKSKSSMTKMHTILTSDDFDFLIAALNDASLEIVEKQEAKKEAMYDRTRVGR